jgi:UPF0716 protein FxsA
VGALVIIFVVVPLLELYVLVQVAHAIGALPALVALAVVSIVGATLVKRQGLAVLGRVRAELDQRRMPTQHLADGALLLGAGVLLTVPGFVTDVVGLALLVPPVRRGVAGVLRRRWSHRARPVAITYEGAIIDTGAAEPSGPRSTSANGTTNTTNPPKELPGS